MTAKSPSKPIDIYTRQSRQGKREESSAEEQERQARSFLESHNLRPGVVEHDADKSGGTLKRPGLQKLLKRVQVGESGGMVVAYLSRASRDTVQGLQLLDTVTQAGGVLYAPNLPDYTTADGRMLTTINFAIDTGYRERKGEELDTAKANAVERGVPVRPHLPPGLRFTTEPSRHEGEAPVRTGVEHDPEVALVMAEFFERRVQGAGPVALAEFLAGHGVKTAYGSTKWSKQAVYGLLSNPAYIGTLKEGEHVNENAWPPVVDRATFEAAQKPERKQPSRPRTAEPQLLTGLVRCSSCRRCLQPTIHRARRLYRCAGAAGECPARARAYVDELDPLVMDAFWRLVQVHHAKGSVLADTAEVDALRAEAAKQERAFLILRDDPEREATIEAMGGMDEWRQALRVARVRWDNGSAALGRAEARMRATPQLPLKKDLRDSWESLEATEKRELLASLIDTVALLPRSTGLPLDRRVVVFAAGRGPADLPARGHLARPAVRPFELPAGAGEAAFEVTEPEAA